MRQRANSRDAGQARKGLPRQAKRPNQFLTRRVGAAFPARETVPRTSPTADAEGRSSVRATERGITANIWGIRFLDCE